MDLSLEAKAAAQKNALRCLIREHRPGDLGWITYRHGVLYPAEHGYNERFEAVVAEIAAEFLKARDPSRERCWIAEVAGERVGSVMLVRVADDIGQLRLMLVEPAARGRGIGTALVDACLQFARGAGYRKVILWTHANLIAARRVYARAGFRLAQSRPAGDGFGRQLIDEIWETDL